MIRSAGVTRDVCYVLAMCCLLGRLCCAEDITVRVINTKDGQGSKDLPIWLFLGEKLELGRLTATTGQDGSAVFHLPDPVPKSVYVKANVSGKVYACSPPTFLTREIIEHGVVAEIKLRYCDPKGKLKGRFKAKPGEVIVFVKFLRWWQGMQT